MDEDRRDAERAARIEYLKPLFMLVIGGSVVQVLLFTQEGWWALAYPVVMLIELAFGVAGLWLSCKLLVGGVGYLGLAILRLAGIYAAMDVLGLFAANFGCIGLIIQLVIYVGLLAWLFEFEWRDAVIVAFVTFMIKLGAGLVLAMVLFPQA